MRARVWRLTVTLLAMSGSALAADHTGLVTIGDVPVPGASITATREGTTRVTVTDDGGRYVVTDLSDGAWTITVNMPGFESLSAEIVVVPDGPATRWSLSLRSYDALAADLSLTAIDTALGSIDASADEGFQQASINETLPAPPTNETASTSFSAVGDPLGAGAADGLLIDGSVNNSAASLFAQARAFGNARPSQRSLYNGAMGVLLGNSAWDARPFLLSGIDAAKPSYDDLHFLATFGGPIRIPGLLRNGPTLFIGYQRLGDNNAVSQAARMPTALERRGDFSQSRDARGRAIQIVDPQTGQSFPNNQIPTDRISPQAAALLAYYPLPNREAGGRFNYQTPILRTTDQESLQSRLTQIIGSRVQLSGTLAYQGVTTEMANEFGFIDASRLTTLDGSVSWRQRVSLFMAMSLQYQYSRLANRTTPHFANLRNVSAEAGIVGNDQDPDNWGPPNLQFSGGTAGLGSAPFRSETQQTHTVSTDLQWWGRARHTLSVGGSVGWRRHDTVSQQDARGRFAFTGARSGSDLADFLLGLPQTAAVAFGNPDKFLGAPSLSLYVNDDWRVSPSLTITAGLRWEFEAPMRERFDRLVNLDVAPGFTAISPIVAANPVGVLTDRTFPASLLASDYSGLQPRVGLAWRPIADSSLVIRAGYGWYRNSDTYRHLALLMAQQPPLSNTLQVESSVRNPLTLADGFLAAPGGASNTVAIDPEFRVGTVQNWQMSAQRDFPGSLTVVSSYLGARGTRLPQQFLPNTSPPGGEDLCPACPRGFVYVTSEGASIRHAAQLQVRRRLRSGFTASAQYTVSEATDTASTFTTAGLASGVIAQDWRHLEAERGPSSFNQRHLLTLEAQYTTGQGIAGGTLVDGLRGALLKDWTFAGQLTVGSGFPLTPVFLRAVPGTGVTGSVRAAVTDPLAGDIPEGFFANPAAYAAPATGEWGNAGRNSITGPSQVTLDLGVSRTFRMSDRLSLDWRIDTTNVLNQVTYASVNTVVGSPQFGLPDRANPMRKVQSSLRLRF